jgi:hypothetical protein
MIITERPYLLWEQEVHEIKTVNLIKKKSEKSILKQKLEGNHCLSPSKDADAMTAYEQAQSNRACDSLIYVLFGGFQSSFSFI